MDRDNLAAKIKERARELGFFDCGIAAAGYLQDAEIPFSNWLKNGYHSGMAYMENHREKRLDPAKLVEGAQSVIVFLHNYYPEKKIQPDSEYLISKYAYGADYHDIIRRKLNLVIDELKMLVPGSFSRAFVDSAPVLERAWATHAGLGWIGKNSMLISRRNGSYYFISEIITDIRLETDKPFGGDYCGDCTKCIDACPTHAIVTPRTIDANRCISNLTIENKGEIPDDFQGRYKKWIFGCDICQDVCPWNRYAFPHSEPEFLLSDALRNMRANDWESLDKEQYTKLFSVSPVKRAKFEGLRRNIEFLKRDSGKPVIDTILPGTD